MNIDLVDYITLLDVWFFISFIASSEMHKIRLSTAHVSI